MTEHKDMRELLIVRRVSGSNCHPHTLVFETIAISKVEDRHYDVLSWYRYLMSPKGYARRSNGRGGTVFLHQDVASLEGWPSSELTDHVDPNDKLNNQVSNIRTATYSQNSANARLRTDSKSGFKGVTWCSGKGKYRAQVRLRRRMNYLGYYELASIAALAYDDAAKKYFGAYAQTNQSLRLLLPVED